ncbi:MAG: hypothetical protein A3D87_07035 [Omnitrophica WOR_2 bacterium RIFCSPHIGHO2_02_FULL_50_17]|nr:MAG: hypothetical protein A3D87_07035 [Omnitrophica WOR_2 bacterium RIFCSPHIGHO2_02_FULL_50_17]
MPKRILLVKTHAIGDTILVTPAMRALRRRFPAAHMALLTGRRSAEIMEGNPDIDEIISFDESVLFRPDSKGIIRLIFQIRRQKFETAFVFHYSGFIHLLVLAFGIPCRIGYTKDGSGFSLTHKIPWDEQDRRWTADIHLDIARFVGAQIEDRSLTVEVPEKDREFAGRFLRQNNIECNDILIGIFPGGGKNSRDVVSQKRWGIEKYAHVVEAVSAAYQAKIIVFGSRDDQDTVLELSRISKLQLINACGKTNLKQTAALLQRCAVLITNDSAPLHIAIAVGTPTVSVFGPSRAASLVDKDARHIIIQSPIPCSPCYCNSVFPGCDKPLCMDAIGCEEVLTAVGRQMKNVLSLKE